MTFAEMKTLLQGRLARFTAPSSSFTGFLEQELQAAQRTLEQLPGLPGFLKTRATGLSLAASSYEVPSDYLRLLEREELPVRITVEGVKRTLTKEDRAYAEERYSGTGAPYCYVLEGMDLHFFPEPDQTYTLELGYYAQDTALAVDADSNKWSRFASELLIAEAGFVLASNYLKNAEAANMFNAARLSARNALYGAEAARDMAGRSEAED